jgi:hypothetical protein
MAMMVPGFYGGVAAEEAGDVRGDDLYSDTRELTDARESSKAHARHGLRQPTLQHPHLKWICAGEPSPLFVTFLLGERHGGRGPGGPTQNGGASR